MLILSHLGENPSYDKYLSFCFSLYLSLSVAQSLTLSNSLHPSPLSYSRSFPLSFSLLLSTKLSGSLILSFSLFSLFAKVQVFVCALRVLRTLACQANVLF